MSHRDVLAILREVEEGHLPAEMAADQIGDVVAMLRSLEWVFDERAGIGICPVCKHAEHVGYGGGHATACALSGLLGRFPR